MLVVVRDDGVAGGHAVRGADQEVEHPPEVLANVLVRLLHLEGARVGVAAEEAPVLDRADVAAAQGLRETVGVKVLDELLEGAAVRGFVGEGLAGVATGREGGEV